MKGVYNQRDGTYHDTPGGCVATLAAFIAINMAMTLAVWLYLWMVG